MRNASIVEKSRKIPGNGSGFWNQDHPPAIKLIYYLQIDTTKGLQPDKTLCNQNPLSSGQYIRNASIIAKSSPILRKQLRFLNQEEN